MHLLLPFKLFLSFLNQAKKKEERNQCFQKKKKFYITSPLNTSKCCPQLKHPLIIQSCSHELDSKWEEEKRRQPINPTWWRTVMIRNELEETWNKAHAKAQDNRLKVPRFYCGLLSQLGWGGWVSEWVSALPLLRNCEVLVYVHRIYSYYL